MSYISLIVPAFHLNTKDMEEINKYLCSQFNFTSDKYKLIEIKDDNQKQEIHYGIVFNESNLSLQKIDQLIYQRNCIQNLCYKAFECLELISKKINDIEFIINSVKEDNINLNNKFNQKKIGEEEEKNNEIINSIKEKEKRKIDFSEKSLKKIKIEFNNMIEEIKLLNMKVNNKKYIQKDKIVNILKNDKLENNDEIIYH
jgi:hypothetical protein